MSLYHAIKEGHLNNSVQLNLTESTGITLINEWIKAKCLNEDATSVSGWELISELLF